MAEKTPNKTNLNIGVSMSCPPATSLVNSVSEGCWKITRFSLLDACFCAYAWNTSFKGVSWHNHSDVWEIRANYLKVKKVVHLSMDTLSTFCGSFLESLGGQIPNFDNGDMSGQPMNPLQGKRWTTHQVLSAHMCAYIYTHIHTYIHTYIHTLMWPRPCSFCSKKTWAEPMGAECRTESSKWWPNSDSYPFSHFIVWAFDEERETQGPKQRYIYI